MSESKTTPVAPSELSPIQKAAIVLLAIGESHAVEVLKNMKADEVQRIGAAMTSVRDVPFDVLYGVMDDFVQDLKQPMGIGPGADDYVRAVMIKALGEERADGMMGRIELSRTSVGMEPLKQMEPRAIAELIRREHPQIISIILSHIEPEHAAAVLKFLQADVRSDVMMRIATLDSIPPTALNELNDVMARKFSGSEQIKSSSFGGIKVAASILNLMESGQEEVILNHIDTINGPLCDQIRELMFVFDNLLDLEDRAIQIILREVSTERLGVALRSADERVRQHIIRNMSNRAGQILLEDMEARGPVRLTEVESAQKEILAVVRRLADEGEIQLVVKTEAFV